MVFPKCLDMTQRVSSIKLCILAYLGTYSISSEQGGGTKAVSQRKGWSLINMEFEVWTGKVIDRIVRV